MTNTTLAINFYSENITTEDKNKFMEAIAHESYDMNISIINDKIASLDRKLNKKDITPEEIQAIESEKSELVETRVQFEDKKSSTLEVYTSVVNEMSLKNEHGFGNSKDAVRTVLRVLATWNNSKLVKYAIIPCFESPRLYEALETIHIASKSNDSGMTIISKDVKEAYKNADKELENIIKVTFSLPFETKYTNKTRVKMDGDDKKLLNECYVKGFKNKFEEEDGIVTFKKRQINTLVKSKKDRKTGEVKYDYTGLATVISDIVIKHYFA